MFGWKRKSIKPPQIQNVERARFSELLSANSMEIYAAINNGEEIDSDYLRRIDAEVDRRCPPLLSAQAGKREQGA